MRGIRKIASLVLVLCLVSASSALMRPELSYAASGATANPPVQAASATKSKKSKKVFLSLKKITLKQGKTRALWAKNATTKVKWSTTNKKIAYVQKTGGKYQHKAVIKAGNKAGTCYIKARVDKKTYKCKVTVKKAGNQGSTVVSYPPVEEIKVETRQLSDSSKNLSAGLILRMRSPAPISSHPIPDSRWSFSRRPSQPTGQREAPPTSWSRRIR